MSPCTDLWWLSLHFMVIQKSCYFLYLLTVIPLLIHQKKIRNSDIQINPSDIIFVVQFHVGQTNFNYTPAPSKGEGGILFYLCPSFHPSVRPRYFSSHFSQFLDPSDSYFLFADFVVDFYTH